MTQILMSTYNGEKYLEEQLESLINQTYKDIKLLIRDDGSTDKTLDILKHYKKKYPTLIEIEFGKNLGVVSSFFKLIELSDQRVDYFAFCDQDDYWEENKIENAIKNIKNNSPFLYFSRTKLVDENLKFIDISLKNKIKINFRNAIVENVVTGCTAVINKKMMCLLKKRKINPKNILMHDWWLYIVASFMGEIFYDKESYILYRQHSNNVVGIQTNKIKIVKNKIYRFIKKRKKNNLKNQIKELLDNYSEELSSSDKIYLEELLKTETIFKRIKNLYKLNFYRHKKLDNFILKILYLFNYF
ncbi:MAG: glycosyltransferase family 2 protein [Fusobacteriaceae bacterium]